MRFVANENIPGPLVDALRNRGHDVLWIVEQSRGTADASVLSLAQREQRAVLTSDKDFAALAFADRHAARHGIILLRLPAPTLDEFIALALAAIEQPRTWAEHLSVIEPGRIRMKALPREESDEIAIRRDDDPPLSDIDARSNR